MAASIIAERLKQLKDQEARAAEAKEQEAAQQRKRLEGEHARQAKRLRDDQTKRQAQEQAERDARLRKGVLRLLERITGKRKRILTENAAEKALLALRDRHETEAAQHRQQHELLRQADRAKQNKTLTTTRSKTFEPTSVGCGRYPIKNPM